VIDITCVPAEGRYRRSVADWWARRTVGEQLGVLVGPAFVFWTVLHWTVLRQPVGRGLIYGALYAGPTALGVIWWLRRRIPPGTRTEVAPAEEQLRAGSVAFLFDTWQRRHPGVAVPGEVDAPDAERGEAIRAALLDELYPAVSRRSSGA
jgi:hypothetical protein